jgi:hypothetical protein
MSRSKEEQREREVLLDGPETEAERVERWRATQFELLGFKPEVAVELAIAGVDWHRARDLLDAGATKAQTRRILL